MLLPSPMLRRRIATPPCRSCGNWSKSTGISLPSMLSHGAFHPVAPLQKICNNLQVIDLNTFSTEELQQAMQAGLQYDGVWMIPENSPQVCSAL
jgi:hypothetical protein